MSWRSRVAKYVVAGVVVLVVGSCSDTTIAPNPQVGSLKLSIIPSSLILQDGENHPVQAVVTDRNGVAVPSLSSEVQWSSSATDTVQVSGDIARALRPGRARVYAVLNAEGVSLADSIPVTVTPVAARMQIVQGDAQRAPVGSTLATSLEVQVLDRHDDPVPGYMVHFATTPTGGQLDPDSVLTDSNGDAQTEWTLPGAPGSYTVSAGGGSAQISAVQFTSTALTLQPASALRIQPDSVLLAAIQDTAHLGAAVYGADGQLINGWEPTWTSVDPSVATVDRQGVVEAQGVGRTRIIASVPGAADTTVINVRQAVTYLQVTGARSLASVGDTLQLGILLLDPNGFPITSGATVRWTSSAPSVATVDGNGLVVATGLGSTEIIASASFLTSRVLIPISPVAAQVTMTPAFSALAVGDTVRFTATAVDGNGHAMPGASFAWSSSDSAVATVSQTGLVTAIANGSATIRAATGSVDGEAAATVGASSVTVSRLSITPATAALHAIGDTIRLAAATFDSTGAAISASGVTWTSLSPAIASVNGVGRVEALATGTARIRAASGSAADTAIITINQAAATVDVSPASVALTLGDSVRLSASVLDAMGVRVPGATVSWSVSGTAASVSASGMVHALAAGGATVTATSGSASGSASVAVSGNQTTVKKLVTTPPTMTLNALGDTATIQATAYDSTGQPVTGASVTWLSLNPGVVSVDASGRITAKAVGLGFIVATSVCCTVADTTSVAVQQKVGSIRVQPASVSLAVGASQQLDASVWDANSNLIPGATVVWASSDTSVATVSTTGLVTAKAVGAAAISVTTATCCGSDTAAVTVSAVAGAQSLLHGYTVDASNKPSGPIPSGWSLVAAQGFDDGPLPSNQFLWGAADATAGTSIESAVAHTGGNAAGGSYKGDGHSVGWQLNSGVVQSREVYVSWWEYDESQGRINDEMFLMRPYVNSGGSLEQEVIFDWMGYNDINKGGSHTGFNATTARLAIEPQAVAGSGGVTKNYHLTYGGPDWGSWTQWEVHYKANDPGFSNGESEVYKNGKLIGQMLNANFNGAVDMTDMAIEIGGVYTKLTWWNGVGTFSAPGSCTDYLGQGQDNGGRVKDFSQPAICVNQAPPNGYVPIFKRYFDDIIVLKK